MSKTIYIKLTKYNGTANDSLSFLTLANKKNALEKLYTRLGEFMEIRKNKDVCTTDVVWGKDYYDNRYYTLIKLKNSFVNKELVNGYERNFQNDGYQEFPIWASIDCKNDDNEELYFCIHYESCSPNWNNESYVTKVIPLSEIDVPIIESMDGVKKIDKNMLGCIEPKKDYKRIGAELPDFGKRPTKVELETLIKLGMCCTFRYGLAYRGAESKDIPMEKALSLLPKFDYGKGFFQLTYSVNTDDIPVLEFNELSVLDME